MNIDFLLLVLEQIELYRTKRIFLNKEKDYYKKYMSKISNNFRYMGQIPGDEYDYALKMVDVFQVVESRRTKNTIFYRPLDILEIACTDAKDAVLSVRSREGF
jgi:hypothetical protein